MAMSEGQQRLPFETVKIKTSWTSRTMTYKREAPMDGPLITDLFNYWNELQQSKPTHSEERRAWYLLVEEHAGLWQTW